MKFTNVTLKDLGWAAFFVTAFYTYLLYEITDTALNLFPLIGSHTMRNWFNKLAEECREWSA